jgi:hypothetical protein
MADVFEQAQEREQLDRQQALKAQQLMAAAAPKLLPTGECQNPLCGEPVDGERLFCGAACAAEHAKRVK